MNPRNKVQGDIEEMIFAETLKKCPAIVSWVKSDINIDRLKKIDFILNFKSQRNPAADLSQLFVDIKSLPNNDPSGEIVHINHTTRNGQIGSLPGSYADFIAVRSNRLYNYGEGFYFIRIENDVWDVIHECGIFCTSSYDSSAWWTIPVEPLCRKYSLFISLDGKVIESKYKKI